MALEVEVIKASRKISDRNAGKLSDVLRVAPYARVSTDTEEQLNSYKSQVAYYTDLVSKRSDWALVDIYADEAVTGTQVTKREDFQRMINDCMDGKIDMIITKSISRFARNTLDTLKFVRMLKEKNIAVFFEDENINTLTMDGELLLVILSSVAQQEVENISANVKKGLKMKMKRGELVGFQSCLGYDYDPNTKKISINETEAEIVRYIFQRYVDGMGAYVIAKELTEAEHKTKNGRIEWQDTSILGIIKNEKYKGDLLQGKTFTVDPISKRRLENYGEEDQFYVKNHHEPIVNEEVFDKAQAILHRRGENRRRGAKGKRDKYSRKFAFSSMLECAFCHTSFSRRSWHSGTPHEKAVWQCITSTKKGKKYCHHSKGLDEKLIEDAFVESYKLVCRNHTDIIDELIKRMESVFSDQNSQRRLNKLNNDIQALEQKRCKLIDLCLDEKIDRPTYEQKYAELDASLTGLLEEKAQLEQSAQEEIDTGKRLEHFRKVLRTNELLPSFDRTVFESIVDKIIIGTDADPEQLNPYKLTFVYKTGFQNSIQGKKRRQSSKKPLKNEGGELCSYSPDDTCGVGGAVSTKGQVKRRSIGGNSKEGAPSFFLNLLVDYDSLGVIIYFALTSLSEFYLFGIRFSPSINREVFDMTDNFWRDLPRPFFILAPMEDVTDVVFRHVVSEAARPDVFFTEFANTESYCHPEGNHSVRGRLTFTEDEQPIVAHIWGDKPEYFRQMSIGMAKEGFRGIDINMGCPVANVAENGKGSGLICRPETAADIIQAAKAGGLPVSVKTRLGFSALDEWRGWLSHILRQDIVNLSIHLRTREEMSKVDAHWELIPEIKKLRDEVAPDTLLTINGDIPDRQTGLQLVEQYGVDGIMIGRGIFHNPFAFEKEPKDHSSEELLDLLRLHLDLHDQYSELEPRSFRPLSRFFKIYVRGFRGASELRNSLMNTKSTTEVRALLNEYAKKEHDGAEEEGN